jgi:hypothetical protein
LSPIIFIIDSENWEMRVRWIGAVEYWRPLPGKAGESGMVFAGMRIRPRAKRRVEARGETAATSRGRTTRERVGRKPRKDYTRIAQFALRCLRDTPIRRELLRSLTRLGRKLLRCVALTRRQVQISLPDPSWNGMLAGWLAAGDAVRGRPSGLRVNFAGRNVILLEVRVYPYRVVNALVRFALGLPYRALYREWRASAIPA